MSKSDRGSTAGAVERENDRIHTSSLLPENPTGFSDIILNGDQRARYIQEATLFGSLNMPICKKIW